MTQEEYKFIGESRLDLMMGFLNRAVQHNVFPTDVFNKTLEMLNGYADQIKQDSDPCMRFADAKSMQMCFDLLYDIRFCGPEMIATGGPEYMCWIAASDHCERIVMIFKEAMPDAEPW